MASVAGRKKSIISNNGVTFEQPSQPVATNTLLNQSASQSTSLYQQCSALRALLMRIHHFPDFFAMASSPDSSRQSTDPVTQVWDCFALGVPLCYIFNLLPPPIVPINVDTDPSKFDASDVRTKKRAIALFAMQIRQVPGCEPFTVTDLWDRTNTDGLVKVIKTVLVLVKQVPEDNFEMEPSSPPAMPSAQGSSESLHSDLPPPPPLNVQEAARNNIIREMVETERKYVQDLEIMQTYANALAQSNTMSQDTIHLLFPGLNKLLNFQRKFLIRLESTAEVPWKDQRWGLHFMENEEEFAVYEPYCANYTNAAELMLAEEQSLMAHNNLINARSELPAFLIKPVQRICKYPLLLDSLIKASNAADYPHYDELKAGSAAAKRITDKINEAQRRAENAQTVKHLEGRIEDWKGHHLSNFGDLLLDDVFLVTKSEVDREYHVFLFEKIILCCKEAAPGPPGKKVGKSNSLLKKQSVPTPLSLPGGSQSKKKNTPLLLKGRIFLNNVTQAVPTSPRYSTASSMQSQHALSVYWRGDDDLEYFTLRCRSEEQLRQWENQVNRLIKEAAIRRTQERGLNKVVSQVSNSTNPAMGRQPSLAYNHEKTSSAASQSPSVYMATSPTYGGPPNGRFGLNPYNSSEEQVQLVSPSGYPRTPIQHQAYPSAGGFDFELDDEFDEYPPQTSYPTSGRGTPMGSRRSNYQSMPPERDQIPGYDRPRAQTEDTNGPVMAQWRTHSPMLPPPPAPPAGSLPLPPGHRPTTPRLMSNQSAMSTMSDASFGPGVVPSSRVPPRGSVPLRSQYSSTKLSSGYGGEPRSTTPSLPPNPQAALSRSRSASQPSAYLPTPKTAPPPLPTATPWANRPNGTSDGKRGSGSSQSTGDSSDYSPNSSSPITPFGSSESSLANMGTLRPSRSQTFDNAIRSNGNVAMSPPVKVKVHFHEDIFVIAVPRTTQYNELVEKVGKKIHLCGRRRDDGPLRVKYRDEDGDMVSLGSTEDVQMAFEQLGPGGQVALYVT